MSKDEFIRALNDEGFKAGFRKGIPTVFIDNIQLIDQVSRNIREKAAQTGYDQSFGIYIQPQAAGAET